MESLFLTVRQGTRASVSLQRECPGAARVRGLEGTLSAALRGFDADQPTGMDPRSGGESWAPPLPVAPLVGLLASHALEPPFRSTGPQPVGSRPGSLGSEGHRRCAIGR